tara:strand:+ start:291 stop:596 length:306 start_codon:yes stop_codon:yes gene_type:complete
LEQSYFKPGSLPDLEDYSFERVKGTLEGIKEHIEADNASLEIITITEDQVTLKVKGSSKPCFDCPDPWKYCSPCMMNENEIKKYISEHLKTQFDIGQVTYT